MAAMTSRPVRAIQIVLVGSDPIADTLACASGAAVDVRGWTALARLLEVVHHPAWRASTDAAASGDARR